MCIRPLKLLLISLSLLMAHCGPQQDHASHSGKEFPDPLSIQPSLSLSTSDVELLVGSGIHDITGPMVGLATMGYAAPAQKTGGLHQRLWARSFVMAEAENSAQRLVYTLIDTCFVPMMVKAAVIERLQQQFGAAYSHANVMITATHTHSGPGAYSAHGMYNQPSHGFSPDNFEIIVDGIVASIAQAHERLAPAQVRMATDHVYGLSRNRSLAAYMLNPQSERNLYDSHTDTETTLLRFDGTDGGAIGMLHWAAAHATSIDKTNKLISGDNKGYAAWKMERSMALRYLSGEGFIAGFANSNAGDASPNTAGDVDGDGDWECAANENFSCARESGERHFAAAVRMYENANQELHPPLRFVHRFVDFSNLVVNPELTGSGQAASTCTGAIGLSMLAGSAEDGPGVLREGISCSTGGPIARLRCLQTKFACHGQKPVALGTGALGSPTMTPNILPTQIFTIGSLALVAVPSELTTMAGRRLRDHLREALRDIGVTHVAIAGYANAYSNYVATREEYQAQHYEGASTLFGEWTLAGYRQVYRGLVDALARGEQPPGGRPPVVKYPAKQVGLAGHIDRVPAGKVFGSVVKQPESRYQHGQVVRATFQGSHLNHSLKKRMPLLEVQRWEEGAWRPIVFDWDFHTKMRWEDMGGSMSHVRAEWDISEDVQPGKYRIFHRGWARKSGVQIQMYEGTTKDFEVTASSHSR